MVCRFGHEQDAENSHMGERGVGQDMNLVVMGCDWHCERDSDFVNKTQPEIVAGSSQKHTHMMEQMDALPPVKPANLAFWVVDKACELDHRSTRTRRQGHFQSQERRHHMLAYGEH